MVVLRGARGDESNESSVCPSIVARYIYFRFLEGEWSFRVIESTKVCPLALALTYTRITSVRIITSSAQDLLRETRTYLLVVSSQQRL